MRLSIRIEKMAKAGIKKKGFVNFCGRISSVSTKRPALAVVGNPSKLRSFPGLSSLTDVLNLTRRIAEAITYNSMIIDSNVFVQPPNL